MRIFFDFEFIEDGITIDPISLGMVDQFGRGLYLLHKDCNLSRANAWVVENVFPGAAIADGKFTSEAEPFLSTREEMRQQVLGFIGDVVPEFWTYYGSYDWVAFCQLFGKMIDLPNLFPRYSRDLKQEADRLGADLSSFDPPLEGNEHNALRDAHWNRLAYEHLKNLNGISLAERWKVRQ